MSGVRRSSRVAAMKDEIDYTGKKVLKGEDVSKKVQKVEKKAVKSKTGDSGEKRKRKSGEVKESVVKKARKSRSRGAKKEDAVVIDESEEGEEEREEELEELEIGDGIPSKIELTLEDSSKINLKEFAKKAGILIIFAYPKASTPGCTRQANGFRDEYKELKSLKAEVLGLSSDNEKAQSNFKTKHELPFHLICDVKRELIKLLGCRKSVVSGTIRSHFIFVDGILKVKEIKISPENSFTRALEFVKSN